MLISLSWSTIILWIALFVLLNQVLEEQRYLLCKSIIPDRHYPYLRSKAILNLDDCEEIDAERTTRKKAARFLDIMVSKGPSAYDHLCQSLMLDTTQMHVLKQLNTEYEDKKNKYLGIKDSPVHMHKV